MDIKQLLELGAKLFKGQIDKAGDGLDVQDIVGALTSLLGDADGKINLQALIGKLDTKGLMSLASSWLGDGGNAAISPGQLLDLFGSKKVNGFANQLGLDKETALDGLTAAIPGIMDKGSQGGSLMDSIGGISDALGGLKGLFG